MPDPSTIRREIERIAADKLKLEGPLPEGDLGELLDSVQRLTLVVAIEDHFEICFEAEDDEAIHRIEDVVAIVARRLEET